MSFSPTTWGAGDHAVVVTYQDSSSPWDGQTWSDSPNSRLAWIDLSTDVPTAAQADAGSQGNSLSSYMKANAGKSYGFLARNGDSRGAEGPTWSHDGQTVVYVSTNAAKDGRLAQGAADLYAVPYNARAGGDAMPVKGASDPNEAEYYPSFSPDDKYIAFDRAPGSENMYYNPHAEVFVIPSGGGTATRLQANVPPACTGAVSPGITNSWAKWSPQATSCSGKTYYWIIFSSSRDGMAFNPANLMSGGTVATSQLYVTAVVDDGTGALTTYPALYIWNQPSQVTGAQAYSGDNQSNHTPTWEVVDIPPPTDTPK
jgi:WD40-like Beta Propeller Repeat